MYIHTGCHCSALARFLTVNDYVQLSLKNTVGQHAYSDSEAPFLVGLCVPAS